MTGVSRGLIRLWAVASAAWLAVNGIAVSMSFGLDVDRTMQLLIAAAPPLAALALITAGRWIARGFAGR